MGASGGFPLDLVLFGMIAAFLVLRLRSILGRRTGFERPPQANPAAARGRRRRAGPVIEGRAEPVAAAPSRAVPDLASPDRPDRWRACVPSIRHSMRPVFWTVRRKHSG